MSLPLYRIDHVEAGEVMLPFKFPRTIARDTKYGADVIRVTLSSSGRQGRGEASPMSHYGDSNARALAQIAAVAPDLARGVTRRMLLDLLPPGGARNAVDAALWDLEGQAGADLAALAGRPALQPIATAYTITIDTLDAVTERAERERDRPLLKVKLGHFETDEARLRAVRKAAPDAALVVDANEGWSIDQLETMAPLCRELGVALIEQPLKAAEDGALLGRDFGIPLCADESCHIRADLDTLLARYAYVNIKLDKSGGATEALALAHEAKRKGFGLMIGCTGGSTLGMAPAFLVAQHCAFCDLDAPMHLAGEEAAELSYRASVVDWSPTRRWALP